MGEPNRCQVLESGLCRARHRSHRSLLRCFRPDNFVFGNNWAKGHYTEGAEFIDSRCSKIVTAYKVDAALVLLGNVILYGDVPVLISCYKILVCPASS
nr:tubulin beta-1 chain [Quercus suber]